MKFQRNRNKVKKPINFIISAFDFQSKCKNIFHNQRIYVSKFAFSILKVLPITIEFNSVNQSTNPYPQDK
jgi:hypothetical protein